MLYEKKKQRPKEFIPLMCIEIVLVVFLVWEIFHYYIDTSKAFWEIKFVDVANIVAQIATAGAFGLGFYQYYRSKKIDRQLVLVAECKAIIVGMVSVIKNFDVGSETNMKNIKSCCIKLGSLGSDFNELFIGLDESVNKGVVRMHWQNMYFNELLNVMEQLSLSAVTDKLNVRPENYIFALSQAKVRIGQERVVESMEKYFTHLYVLESGLMSGVRKSFKASDFSLFALYFFEGEYTEDYMYGSLSRLDIRTRAPLIAAIKEACGFKV